MGSIGRDSMKERLARSIWSVVILALLVDTCAPALLHRRKRQDLGSMVHHFLQADDQAQLEYVRHGLDLLQQGVDTSLGQLGEIDQAQDRVFVASAQSLITALQTILNDPSSTPTALSSLATDPSNILTLVTLVIATAFAAQISAFTLFGDPGSSSSRGILGMILDLFTSVMEGMNNGEEDMEEGSNDIEMNGEDESMDGEDNMSDNMTDGSGEGSGDGMGTTDDMMDEDMNEEESQGGIIEAVIAFITGIFSRNSDNNEMSENGNTTMTEEGSGDMSESEGSGMEEDSMINVESDGGSSFGGVSISLHPIDLAALFVQVQEAIGINCTCADGAMTEEMVTNATLRLIETEQMKKKRKLKKTIQKTEKKKSKRNKKVKKVKGKRIPKDILI